MNVNYCEKISDLLRYQTEAFEKCQNIDIYCFVESLLGEKKLYKQGKFFSFSFCLVTKVLTVLKMYAGVHTTTVSWQKDELIQHAFSNHLLS